MKAREAEPANPLLFYNIGTCQYRLGNYEEAKKELESAVRMPDKKMAAKAAYNLANTHFRMGEKAAEGSERIAAWRESVAYLKKAIDLDNGFENAKKERGNCAAQAERRTRQAKNRTKTRIRKTTRNSRRFPRKRRKFWRVRSSFAKTASMPKARRCLRT
jgi:Tetratricopeptide repeat.